MRQTTLIFSVLLVLICATGLFAQSDTLWTKTFGTSTNDEYGHDGHQTVDGGYIVLGNRYTNSEVWLLKLDESGNQAWKQTFELGYVEYSLTIQELSTGGYIIAGFIMDGIMQAFLLKTDESGNEVWRYFYPNEFGSVFASVKETSDGGFIAAGYDRTSDSFYRALFVKIDSNGNLEFSKVFFTPEVYVQFYDVALTDDGGYVFSGKEQPDLFLLKTDGLGNEVWWKTYQENGLTQNGYSIKQALDGGYIVGGLIGLDINDQEFYLVKTDSLGNLEWKNTFGGEANDACVSVCQTRIGTYILAGYTDSFGAGTMDAYVIRADEYGNEVWSATYGGSDLDYAWSISTTEDDGYFIVGSTESFGPGYDDIWVMRLEKDEGLNIEVNPYQTKVPVSGTLDFEMEYANYGAETDYATVTFSAYGPEGGTPAWSTSMDDFEFTPGVFTKQYALPIPSRVQIDSGYKFEAVISEDETQLAIDSFEWEVKPEMTSLP